MTQSHSNRLQDALEENVRLRTALEKIAEQLLIEECEEEGDYEYGYNAIIKIARDAIK